MNIETTTDVRISVTWQETFLDLLGDDQRVAGDCSFQSRPFSYGSIFEHTMEKPVLFIPKGPLYLEPPWPKPTGQRFWRAYLGQQPPAEMTGEKAWKSLVPFRIKLPLKIAADWTNGKWLFEIFLFPHGIALTATLLIFGQQDMAAVVKQALQLRRTGKLKIEWPWGTEFEGSLEAVAEHILRTFKLVAWGEPIRQGRRTALDPYTIFTVVKGTVTDLDKPIGASEDLQRTLEAVTSWQRDPLPNLQDRLISSGKSRRNKKNEIVYGEKRGRAVWFPEWILQKPKTLVCYHRNLLYASIQTESLCGLVSEARRKIAGQALSTYERGCVCSAAGILGRLYGGDGSVYKCWSVRSQVDQNDFAESINYIRVELFEMEELK